jgi:alpha-galactosidase
VSDTPISYDGPTRTWLLVTPSTGYAVRLVDGQTGDVAVRHVYWGPRLSIEAAAALPAWADGKDQVLGEELAATGGHRFGPPGLQVEFADGARAVEWRYVNQSSTAASCGSRWPTGTTRWS